MPLWAYLYGSLPAEYSPSPQIKPLDFHGHSGKELPLPSNEWMSWHPSWTDPPQNSKRDRECLFPSTAGDYLPTLFKSWSRHYSLVSGSGWVLSADWLQGSCSPYLHFLLQVVWGVAITWPWGCDSCDLPPPCICLRWRRYKELSAEHLTCDKLFLQEQMKPQTKAGTFKLLCKFFNFVP